MIGIRNFSNLTSLLVAALFASSAWAATAPVHTMPNCGCCTAYVKYLQKEGFDVTEKPAKSMKDMRALAHRMGVPKKHGDMKLPICHFTKIGDYLIVGHVPAKAIRRLLREKPQGIKGIILPGMPPGSPGMGGEKLEPFVVYAFDGHGKSWVYAKI
ncbi:MAG: DUF411 domain-containing protein [Rhodanobacteraceae bacterium]